MNALEQALLKDVMSKFERMTIAQERIAGSLEQLMINTSPKPIDEYTEEDRNARAT